VLSPTYPLETERLLIRPFTADDHADMFAFQSRADVTRYLYYEPYTPDELTAALTRKAGRTALEHEGDSLNLAVVPKDLGRVVGDVTLFWHSEENRQGEIGYVFHPDHHGRGYAREAAEALLRIGFDELGLHRIVGRLDARNLASAALLERLGMRREAHLVENEWVKGRWTDEVVYALLDREWAERTR
jgi:RimJ/RimL family protein N-acetyltransferase